MAVVAVVAVQPTANRQPPSTAPTGYTIVQLLLNIIDTKLKTAAAGERCESETLVLVLVLVWRLCFSL